MSEINPQLQYAKPPSGFVWTATANRVRVLRIPLERHGVSRSNPMKGPRYAPSEVVSVLTDSAVPGHRLATRAYNKTNPDHHLWLNNGTYFIHFTLHIPGYRKLRLRRSLGTKDREVARRLRDEILTQHQNVHERAGEVAALPVS